MFLVLSGAGLRVMLEKYQNIRFIEFFGTLSAFWSLGHWIYWFFWDPLSILASPIHQMLRGSQNMLSKAHFRSSISAGFHFPANSISVDSISAEPQASRSRSQNFDKVN